MHIGDPCGSFVQLLFPTHIIHVGVPVLLDLHTHSIKSDDGRAKVENYCQWIRSKNLPIDGFVLTEHR
ncbi:MAG: hypothetical protein NWR09_03765, partial [Pseudomonadales bacterium]|nr:hypothetical protein [Pseudomonadales bacterium]